MRILQLTTHATTAQAERVERDGKLWLRVPVVAVREQVLNGELLTMGELGESLAAWDGVPIPLDHPFDGTQYISAHEAAAATSIVGEFADPYIEGRSLKGYMYLDVERMQAMGGSAADILARFERGDMVEVSTGYYAMSTDDAGTHRGIPYTGIHTDITPDHLALLTAEVGACSIADGCGAGIRVHIAADIDIEQDGATDAPIETDEVEMAEKAKNQKVEDEAQIEQDAATEAAEDGNEVQDKEPAAPVANKRAKAQPCAQQVVNAADVQALVANAVAEAVKPLRAELDAAKQYIANQEKAERDAVTQRILTHAKEFSAEELAAMPITTLLKLERTVAPAVWNFERPVVNGSGYGDESDWVEYEAPAEEVK